MEVGQSGQLTVIVQHLVEVVTKREQEHVQTRDQLMVVLNAMDLQPKEKTATATLVLWMAVGQIGQAMANVLNLVEVVTKRKQDHVQTQVQLMAVLSAMDLLLIRKIVTATLVLWMAVGQNGESIVLVQHLVEVDKSKELEVVQIQLLLTKANTVLAQMWRKKDVTHLVVQ